MKYQGKSFHVGGYTTKEAADNWERTFKCPCCGHAKHAGICDHVETDPNGTVVIECDCKEVTTE